MIDGSRLTLRLFAALELPAPVRSQLWTWSAALDEDVWRRVPEPNLHVTLAFLGARLEEDVAAIAAVLQAAPDTAPRLSCGEAVALPPRRPRVLAVTLTERGDALARLQAAVSAGLAADGLHVPEGRAFLAHVTVARTRKRGAPPGRGAPVPEPPSCEFDGPAVTLFESRPGPGGSRYTALASLSLRSPG
jgi:2'-5' RNA ligase